VLALLVLIFIVVPLAELYVIIKVGEAIGALNTIALLILDSIVGVALLRSQGRRAWARFNQALAEGRVPGKEIADGALIIVGGALLLTPGFISDALGVLLLIPPTRAVIRGILARTAFRRMAIGHRTVAWGSESARGPRGPFGPHPEHDGRDYDVEGTAHEVDDNPRDPGSEPPALPR
jgi:UPF0716 protein FxsA